MLVDSKDDESGEEEDEGIPMEEVTEDRIMADVAGVEMEDFVEGEGVLDEIGSPSTPSSKVYSM